MAPATRLEEIEALRREAVPGTEWWALLEVAECIERNKQRRELRRILDDGEFNSNWIQFGPPGEEEP